MASQGSEGGGKVGVVTASAEVHANVSGLRGKVTSGVGGVQAGPEGVGHLAGVPVSESAGAERLGV